MREKLTKEQIEINIRLDKKRKMRRLMFSHLLIRLRYRNGNKNIITTIIIIL